MESVTYKNTEDLAFTYWQYNANEKAFEENMITKDMYNHAKETLQKNIDQLSKLCYTNNNGG